MHDAIAATSLFKCRPLQNAANGLFLGGGESRDFPRCRRTKMYLKSSLTLWDSSLCSQGVWPQLVFDSSSPSENICSAILIYSNQGLTIFFAEQEILPIVIDQWSSMHPPPSFNGEVCLG